MSRQIETITITADILRRTEKAVFIFDGAVQVWLPLSQVECEFEPGETAVELEVPEWLAMEKGLI